MPGMPGTLVLLCLLTTVSARLSAELKYTVHMDAKKAETPGAQATNPMLAMMGDAMTKQVLPAGGADMVYTIGESGTRIEYLQAAMGFLEGAVNLARPDGTVIVMNPKDKTYWKSSTQSATAAMQSAGVAAPQANVKRTGEFATVAGLKCEIVTIDMKFDLPIPEAARASLPPDFPRSLAIAGDGCVTTDQFQKYAELAAKSKTNDMMAAIGLDKVSQGGIVLRQRIRIAGVELSSLVTKIEEAAAPATAFDVPADYKEVPPPQGMR
jgi:hypothetical protein